VDTSQGEAGRLAMLRFTSVLFGVVLLLALPAYGQDFQKGLDAYINGDYATALKEWSPLAEQGYAGAQNNLGIMYKNGRGVLQDYAEAVRLYRLAAEQGLADAQYSLGWMYYNGKGVAQDYVLAHMWANLAAAQGNEKAVQGRDIVAGLMTPAQIAEAQRMAREWQEAYQ
jgi:hypothetical protein